MKRIIGLAAINLALVIVLGFITPYFLTKANFIVMVDNMALEAVILAGYTLLLVGGYFDLSVDGIVAVSGVTLGLIITAGISWVLASLVALIIGIGIGLFNGIIVSKFKINGLIATLTTWWICIGFSLGLTRALAPYNFPDSFQILAQERIFGFRVLIIYAILAVVILSVILHFTRMGSRIYVSGDNRQSAELMGIDVVKLGIILYTLVGLLAGFVGIMMASRLDAASPVAVDGMTLRVIAAIVIGGGSLSGGKGTIIAGLLGLILMHILSNAVIQLGVSPYWQKAMLGSVLLIAVLSEKLNLKGVFK